MGKTKSEALGFGCDTRFSNLYGYLPYPADESRRSIQQNREIYTVYGDNVIGWKQLIARGQNATTDLRVKGFTISPPNTGTAWYEDQWHNEPPWKIGTKVTGDLTSPESYGVFPSNSGTTVDSERVLNLAKMKFIKKATEAQTKLQGLVSLGEIAETLHMIRHPLQTMWKSSFWHLNSIRNRAEKIARRNGRVVRDKVTRREIGRMVSGTWIEYSFGVRPLIADIEDAGKAVQELFYRPPRLMIRARVSQEKATEPYSDNLIAGNCVINRRYTQTDFHKVVLYGVVDIDSTYKGGLDAFGLTVHEFLPTIWELIPYSFMVDYFTNIGDCLSAWAFNRAPVRWIVMGERKERIITLASIDLEDRPAAPLYVKSRRELNPGGSFSSSCFDLSRFTYYGTLIPTLEFTIPGLGMKWLNIAALAGLHKSTSRRLVDLSGLNFGKRNY